MHTPLNELPDTDPIRQWHDSVCAGKRSSDAAALEAKTSIGPAILPYALEWLTASNGLLKAAALKTLQRFDFQVEPEPLTQTVKTMTEPIPARQTLNQNAPVLTLLEGSKFHDTPLVRQTLTKLLEHPNDQISAKAVQTLASFQDADALESVLDSLAKKETQEHHNKRRRIKILIGIVVAYFLLMAGLSLFIDSIHLADWFRILSFSSAGIGIALASNMNRFRQSSVEALKEIEDIRAIGPLAMTAQNRHQQNHRVAAQAINVIEKLLDRVTEDAPFSFPPEQMRAIVELLNGRDLPFERKLIRALQFIGDETALEKISQIAQNTPAPSSELTDIINQALPVLQKRVERLQETRVLLRAADESNERQDLLRASSLAVDPTEEEQLLRPNQPEPS